MFVLCRPPLSVKRSAGITLAPSAQRSFYTLSAPYSCPLLIACPPVQSRPSTHAVYLPTSFARSSIHKYPPLACLPACATDYFYF